MLFTFSASNKTFYSCHGTDHQTVKSLSVFPALKDHANESFPREAHGDMQSVSKMPAIHSKDRCLGTAFHRVSGTLTLLVKVPKTEEWQPYRLIRS